MKIYIGIDLHKTTSTWVVLGESGDTALMTRVLPVIPVGIAEGIALCKKLGTDLSVVLEPCCGWLWVEKQLRDADMDVHISNPRKVRAIADSLQKTDPRDAYMLAKLLRTGALYESVVCSPEIRKLRSLCRVRSFLVNLGASTKCRLESVITREGRHLILGASSSKKANEAIVAHGNTEWNLHINLVKDITKHITLLEKEMAQYADLPIPKLLQTMPGVGIITASTVYAEVGNFADFPNSQALTAFAGLVPTERSSGGVRKLGHITKAGSKQLRYMIVEAAMHIRSRDKSTVLYDFYATIKKTRGAMRARTALARKMLSIIWYMVRDNQPYEQRFHSRTT